MAEIQKPGFAFFPFSFHNTKVFVILYISCSDKRGHLLGFSEKICCYRLPFCFCLLVFLLLSACGVFAQILLNQHSIYFYENIHIHMKMEQKKSKKPNKQNKKQKYLCAAEAKNQQETILLFFYIYINIWLIQ